MRTLPRLLGGRSRSLEGSFSLLNRLDSGPKTSITSPRITSNTNRPIQRLKPRRDRFIIDHDSTLPLEEGF